VEAHPDHQPHAKALEHVDMGMPAAEENNVLALIA
jgi:hypothetical protein